MQNLKPFGLFYFCYFSFYGLFDPFLSLYLSELSFSAFQISSIIALSTLARIIAPAFWGYCADRSGRRKPLIVGTALLALLASLPMSWLQHYWGIFACLALMHFFWVASLPLVEASTLQLTQATPGLYSRIRIWGSAGFVALSIGGGYLFEWFSIQTFVYWVMLPLGLTLLASLLTPEVAQKQSSHQTTSIKDTLRQPKVIALFACCFLMALAMGPYYAFYSIRLGELGFNQSLIGYLWAMAVVSEMVMFWLAKSLFARFSHERLMTISLIGCALRFVLMVTLLQNTAWAFAAQSLHAFTFGLHHVVSVGLINRYFKPNEQARGQSLYVIASFGIGGSTGGLLAGWFWDSLGANIIYTGSFIVACVGILVSLYFLKPEHTNSDSFQKN